jgi:hypothetical protein
MNSEQLVNDIEKLDIKQQNIECKLRELRIFYITNKEKYDYNYKLARTFLDDLRNFIEKEIISDDLTYLKNKFGEGSNDYNNSLIINYTFNYKDIINDCLLITEQYNNNVNHGYTPEQFKQLEETHQYKKKADDSFNCICNYGEERLILIMLINKKKLKCYENIKKLYFEPEPEPESEKPVIEKNSIISSNKTLIALDEAYSKIEEYGASLDDAYSKINKYEIKFSELCTVSKYERLEIEKNSIISSNKTLIALAEAYSKIEEYGTILDEAYSKINKYEKKLTELYSESKYEKLVIEKNSIIYNELVISSNKTLTALDKAYNKIEKYDTALNDAYSKINKYEIKFTELYTESKYEKQVIEKKQYSVSASVIFFIMIAFYVITVMTVVLIVNYNYNYNYNYDYDVMHHSMQCGHNTRLIDKHNKLADADKDIMII